ncbi:MAG: class I SAM-dependent methyltransferase [Kiritimatiellia bacterium]|jgi:predicted O-methyltransferase YrrM
MKFDDVYAIVGSLPCTEENQCRILYDWIIESKPKQCLELGFLYGKTSCIIAAALEENGEGKLTSIDLESVRNHQNNPNILDNLKRSNLGAWVEPIFSKVSYTWELKGIIEQQTTHGICQPKYDFIFLDGAHLWETDVCAFFLGMKLLVPGGWFLFDDYMWSVNKSDWWHKAPSTQGWPDDYRNEAHVERLVTLVVSQHPDIESVVIRDNWVWARKKSTAECSAGPSVTHLNKSLIREWLRGRIFGSRK